MSAELDFAIDPLDHKLDDNYTDSASEHTENYIPGLGIFAFSSVFHKRSHVTDFNEIK